MQGLSHGLKPLERRLNEFLVYNLLDFILGSQIIFLNLEGLFQRTLFQFNEVPVIPMKEGDLTIWMRDFANDSHGAKIGLQMTNYECRMTNNTRSTEDLQIVDEVSIHHWLRANS